MRFPILASVLVLCVAIAFSVHRTKQKQADDMDEFWEKERQANSTRRKSLDGLAYITIPFETFPLSLHNDNERIAEYINTIRNLCDTPVVNLTGISNTDLKLQYGAPNIDLLSKYDQCYTTLVSVLNRWGCELYEFSLTESGDMAAADLNGAKKLFEFAISTGTDVSGTYHTLADIYKKEGNSAGMENLISTAQTINTPMKAAILKYLEA